jgi:hypothetical protein
MGSVAGADEAEQTPRRPGEPTPTAPRPASEQALAATRPVSEPATARAAAQKAPTEPAQTAGQAPAQPEQAPEQAPQSPGFGERGRMRRRARFLRKARELAYRDLGGLVFDLHRFGQRNDQLVLLKLATLRQIDTELRELEEVLRDRRPVTVLREVGIAACPRCAAIHGSDDRFCPGCGLAFDTHADRPISTAPVSPPVQAPPSPSVSQPPAPAPAPAPATAQVPAAAYAPERKEPDRAEEDEPTQILRPPATGA